MVESSLKVLSLEDQRNAVVGDEVRRGISGGQRKRLNIGIELVAAPKILFVVRYHQICQI